MIISDLNYLEVIAKASSITGGQLDIGIDIAQAQNQDVALDLDPKKLKTNVGILTQLALGTAVAVALNGKALANAKSQNKTK